MANQLPTLKVIQVSFPKTKSKYSYYSPFDVKEGDIVVVCVQDEYACGTVHKTEGLSDSSLAKAHKSIVQVVDTETYQKTMDQLVRIKEVKLKLKQRKEQLDESILYAQLAQTDPEMQALVDEMNGLTPNAIPKLTA